MTSNVRPAMGGGIAMDDLEAIRARHAAADKRVGDDRARLRFHQAAWADVLDLLALVDQQEAEWLAVVFDQAGEIERLQKRIAELEGARDAARQTLEDEICG